MGTTYDYRGDSFRSKFELNFAKNLYKRKIKFKYEPQSFEYYLKSRLTTCRVCGSRDCWELHHYTPDFFLPEYNFYIETKGKFPPPVRRKMVAVKMANKEINLRLVFMANNKLDKSSNQRYSDWARKNGFIYTIGLEIPEEWLTTTSILSKAK